MSGENVLSFGDYRFLVPQHTLTQGDRRIRIGSRARGILAALLERAGEVVPKGVLMKRVWGGVYVDEGTLRVHVASLRKILSRDRSGARYIETVTGFGYRFAAPVTSIGRSEQIAGSREIERLTPDQDLLPQIAECLQHKQVSECLRRKKLLFLVDNGERIVDAAPLLVALRDSFARK
jgi:DNA-binding winged helix-turn-helix (wHTH) protein